MKNRTSLSHIPRRTFLAGVGTTAAGTLLRPLFASAAGASPTRLLVVHRPCGTYPVDFFPQSGDTTSFTLPPILQPFAPVQDAMTIMNGIYCPRDHGWPGDQHGAGLITMMSGKRPIEIPGTSSGGDPNAKNQQAAGPSFDQMMLTASAAGLGGTAVPSIQSTAYRPSSIGLPNFKVMSYDTAGALFPESRPDTLFGNVFAASMPGLSQADLDRLRAQNKSILDFVSKDLSRLRGLVPKSQLPKLDAHLDGLSALEAKLTAAAPPAGAAGATCNGPAQAALPAQTGDLPIDEAQHQVVAQNQLAIILAAFQCDLTRVATFSFAHGNSALRFAKIIPGFNDPGGTGHHDLSHVMTATALHSQIDQWYSQQLVQVLQAMKNTPDGDGTLLDHTLVVYFNECCYGWSHSIENMPLLLFGGKSLKLQTGRHLKFGMRYMNDVWAAIATAMGVPMNTYGDTAFSTGAVSGVFG
ncbi:MAG TPA: DUF1552 domain-containing protein [Polyangia bacterium]|nr:DUF1552 domain-containing protein [Polyangia bacterium]